MTLEEFNSIFKLFVDYYEPKSLSVEKQKIYFSALRDLELATIQVGFTRLIADREFTNFPSVAEIRKYSLGTKEEHIKTRIQIAKEKVKRAIRMYGANESIAFDDPAIHAVIVSFGGWEKLCTAPLKDFENFFTFEFEKVYKAYIQAPFSVAEKFLGIFDRQNGDENLFILGEKQKYIEWVDKKGARENLIGDNARLKSIGVGRND